ncbi:hypothetical protein BT67DRAFT_78 [Trichocladium antarcticum]|uniref:Uncharacterized protein n=1 Tax=Trichocladium antarcticum TaxID=1450529 RepID=A0AAN6ZGC9_9PEZI|nr:hypothetical protein BT67DRAFT_78 [Trichocladium antarcticum]
MPPGGCIYVTVFRIPAATQARCCFFIPWLKKAEDVVNLLGGWIRDAGGCPGPQIAWRTNGLLAKNHLQSPTQILGPWQPGCTESRSGRTCQTTAEADWFLRIDPRFALPSRA